MGDGEAVEWALAALTYSRAELAGMINDLGITQTVGLVPAGWLDPALGLDVRNEWDACAHGIFSPRQAQLHEAHLRQVLLSP